MMMTGTVSATTASAAARSRWLTRLTTLFFVALLAGCATAPQHESQTAPNVDLARYQTFKVEGPSGVSADQPLRLLDVNIRKAITDEMTRRGYVETADKPQLLVTYDNSTSDKVKSNPFRIGIGLGSFGGHIGGGVNVGSPSVQNYKEGKLVIHVLDAAENRELWFGSLSGKVDRSSLDAAAVARVVAQAMEGFPARAGSPAAAPAAAK